MQIFSIIVDFIRANMLAIGLILISPACYRLAYGITIWVAGNFFDKKKDIVIRHFHNNKLVSETTIKAKLGSPLIIKTIEDLSNER